MGAYVTAAAALAARFQCAVIIIHHCGMNESRPRGHTSLTGAVEAQIGVRRDAAGLIVAAVEYMKDGPEEGRIVSRLETVQVDLDEDGEPVTSCVIADADDEAPGESRRQTKPRKLPAAQIRALSMLREAILTDGQRPPASNHIPPDKDCVSEKTWRQYCYQGGISTGDTQQAKHKAYSKAAETLIAEGQVGAWDEWVWLV
jgi:hypothetical protein